ncbi:MAG: UDP-glucose 4-epimerase GalE [Planctomycetota bacterium]|jgi:UDP-glucose 4-epimerase
MNVLVTGGAGFIGSHAALRLLEDGHAVTVVDDLTRGHAEVIEILRPHGDVSFLEANLGDTPRIAAVMREREIDLVMHFGGLTYVGESVEEPLRYYRGNAAASIGLLEAMDEAGVNRLVFSSTCATYGEPSPEQIPIRESCPQAPVNPYGRTKLLVEQVIKDVAHAKAVRGEPFGYALLRYFNVAGSDRAGRLGEDHRPETHLVPICLEAALGLRDRVTIFGTDYPTPDGTCIRDYLHVEDLVDAHVEVMAALEPGAALVYNVGIGRGHSVHEVVEACQRVTGVQFDVQEGSRRPGDPPQLYSDPSHLQEQLGWSASETDLDAIIASAWRWRQAHREGYGSS